MKKFSNIFLITDPRTLAINLLILIKSEKEKAELVARLHQGICYKTDDHSSLNLAEPEITYNRVLS